MFAIYNIDLLRQGRVRLGEASPGHGPQSPGGRIHLPGVRHGGLRRRLNRHETTLSKRGLLLQEENRILPHTSMQAFVFCAGDCLFESKPSPNSANACGKVTSCAAGCQKVGRGSTRRGSWGMYITFASAKKQIRQNPLWL